MAVSEVIIEDRASAVLGRIEGALDRVTTAEVKTTRSADAAGRSFEQLRRAADPVYGTLAKLADQQGRLQRAVDLGRASQVDANAVSAKLHSAADLTIKRLGGMTAAHGDLTKATRFTHTEMAILQSGVINTVQSLAAGQGAFRTLQTQLFQTAPAFGTVARSITLAQLGLIGIAAPLAIAATGFAVLLQRASAAEAQMRSFNVILSATGNLGNATPRDLLGVTRQLRGTGSTASEAQSLVEAAARTPGINPASLGTLTTLARDIASGTGREAIGVVQGLEKALLGGADAAAKFVFQLAGPNGLTAAETGAMREMDRLGDRAGAAGVAIGALQRRFGDLHEKSMSPSTRLAKELTSSWQSCSISLARRTRSKRHGKRSSGCSTASRLPQKPVARQSRPTASRSGGIPPGDHTTLTRG